MAKKPGTGKIANRLALNSAREDQSAYTDAIIARYEHIASGAAVERDFSSISDPVNRAFAIEGFLNKAGHAANKEKAGIPVPQALADFEATISEGSWTNREGGVEINLEAVQTAFAALRNRPLEAVKEAWDKFSDAERAAIRANPQVKAKVAAIRAEKLAALAAASTEDTMPNL